MLRHTTVAELEALQHRVAELKRSSLKPEAVEETTSAVALAIRQKAAQHQLELDRVWCTVLKTTVARSMQQVAGAAAEEQEGGVSSPRGSQHQGGSVGASAHGAWQRIRYLHLDARVPNAPPLVAPNRFLVVGCSQLLDLCRSAMLAAQPPRASQSLSDQSVSNNKVRGDRERSTTHGLELTPRVGWHQVAVPHAGRRSVSRSCAEHSRLARVAVVHTMH